jgi:hypothetical protein
MRAGDTVFHRPSAEKWVLAFAGTNLVAPCGWPACTAKKSDCDLVRACTDAEHREMLEKWANKKTDEDFRTHECREQLFELNKGYLGAGI